MQEVGHKENMKYSTDFKNYILETCKKLRWEFFVNEYQMTVGYSEEAKLDNEEVAATISSDGRYLNFKITIYPTLFEYWKKKDLKTINEALTHEFCHLLTDPPYDFAVKGISDKEHDYLTDIRERQTQRITNIIFPLLKEPFKIKSKAKPRKKKK